MDIQIRKVQIEDLSSFNKTLNEVASERKYLANITGFPLEIHERFLQNVFEQDAIQMVAVDGAIVVGWKYYPTIFQQFDFTKNTDLPSKGKESKLESLTGNIRTFC